MDETEHETLATAPYRADALKHYAATLRQLGAEAEARQALERFRSVVEMENQVRRLRDSLLMRPDDPGTRVELVELLLKLARHREAVDQLERLRRAFPGHPAIPDLARMVDAA